MPVSLFSCQGTARQQQVPPWLDRLWCRGIHHALENLYHHCAVRCFDIAHSNLPCHLPSATHVTHSLPFPAKYCGDVPECWAKCWAAWNTCIDASTNVWESDDCYTDQRKCTMQPPSANKEDVVDNEGSGLRGSNSKTIVADV